MDIFCHDALFRDCVEIYAKSGEDQVIFNPIVQKIEPAPAAAINPSLDLRRHEAQQLMNELWRIGLRPRDGRGAPADVDHLEKHIDDLRKIAFKVLEVRND